MSITDGWTFTASDTKQLEELESRYAPQGVPRLKSDVLMLNAQLRESKTTEGADALRRSFWQSHTPMQDGDREKLKALHKKSLNARTVESSALSTLKAALSEGLISQAEYDRRSREESNRALTDLRKRAHDLLFALHDTSSHHTFGSLSTDADRRKVMDAFNRQDEWQRTLDRFAHVYNAADPARKAELRQSYPELYESAIG